MDESRVRSLIGERIKTFRGKKGLSLSDLSANTGIPEEELTGFEAGDSMPPVGALMQLASALEVTIGGFFQSGMSEKRVEVVRAADRWKVSPPSDSAASMNYSYQALSYQMSDKQMAPFLVEIRPGQTETGEASKHEGEEFHFVLAGEVEEVIGGESHVLRPGDAIYFDSRIEHSLRAVGQKPATILACVAAPQHHGDDDSLRRAHGLE